MTSMKNFSETRVLVTGGNGFIGSHLTERLVSLNADVSVFSRSGNSIKINDLIKKIKFFKVDLTNKDLLRKSVKSIEPEIIFHLASETNVSRDISLLEDNINNNLMGTLNLLNALSNIKYNVFVNTGTCEEYGNGKVPFSEDQTPTPVSPYSASKVATTYYCKMLYETQKLPITTLRPFLTYGPKQVNNMLIPSSIISALQNKDFQMTRGEQTRDFIYVENVVEAYLKAAYSKRAIGEIINIGSGKERKIIDTVKLILKLTESRSKIDDSLPYRPGETMHFYCSNKKAKDLLDWQPTTELGVGLKRTIEWCSSMLKSGELKKWMPQKN
ncbi:MAG: NAD-dependent epimerase/dehydratase family protein [Nanoarchaeota archaeon]